MATHRVEEIVPPFYSSPESTDSSERSIKDEIRQRLASNRTLYEFTAKSEEKEAEILKSQILQEQQNKTEIAAVEVTSENMGEVLAEMAQSSPRLNESLNALAQARKTSIPGFTPEGASSLQVAEAKPKALINVSDFSHSEPISDTKPAENHVEFQVQNADEAQNALSQELLAQAEGLNPVQEIQISGEVLEQAQINQAVGTRTTIPNPQKTSINSNLDDLDQNPLATIVGLKPSSTNETQTENETEPESPMNSESSPESEVKAEAKNEVEAKDETEAKNKVETEAEIDPPQTTGTTSNHQPTRMKKPVRNQGSEPSEDEKTAPILKDEYSLDVYRVNLRKALASFQIETGLKVVASLDVQGTVSCKSKNADPEILLASLLADTQFKFVRNGDYIYVAQSNQLQDLPKPLEKTDTEIFVPEHISLEELELVFRSNLSQFGTCEVTRDSSGKKGLSVTDWILTLEQLEKIQQIVDVPAPEERVNAFVFQRELDGTFKSLELVEMAESQGLVLQRVTPQEAETKEEKKSFFYGRKKEKTSEIQAFTISYRPDTFLVSVRNQLKTLPAPMPGQTSAPFELEQPMKFDFNLNVQERVIPYHVTVTYHGNAENSDGTTAEVVCAPREVLGSKAKAKDFHFTLAIPTKNRNSLILQLNLGEFPVENSGKRKDISYMMQGNRMKKEVVIVLCPFQSVPKIQKNGLSTQAIREIVRQQEVLARKFYGSLELSEREDSKRCFGIAQRLRMGLGEVTEPVEDEIPQKIELE